MVTREYGYKKTEVSGTEFIIKEKHAGTDLSSAARRLATREDVRKVEVEHTGVITLHVQREDHWVVRDIVPDDFEVVDAMIHPSDIGQAAAHLDIERTD